MSPKPDSEVLEELVQEAKAHWVPRSSAGDAQEEKLFARIDAEERQHAGRGRVLEGRFWGPVALITAVAAGVVFFAHPRGHGASSDAGKAEAPSVVAAHETRAPSSAGEEARPTLPAELTLETHEGVHRVDGIQRAVGDGTLHDGQTLEARGGETVFQAPGRVDWLLESGTEVSVVRAGTRGGSIVLALRVGAVEAQVVPVPAGEAFAVDVDGVRVAVHGTHLRVERKDRGGTRVVVDLSEGVISVGVPPKTGSTVGVLVNAPAHVEFSVLDVAGTLHVDREASHVRPPVDPLSLSASEGSEPPAPGSAITTAGPPPATPAMTAPRNPAPPAPKPLTPTEVVAAAVQSCADQKLPKNGAIISSMLTVDVGPDGSARLATFDPPLPVVLQSCVAAAVYATPWGEPGSRRIPIELHQ